MGRSSNALRTDVHKEHCGVYVESQRTRFIIPTIYLNDYVFKALSDKAKKENGFDHHMGFGIPCDETDFQYLNLLI